jgi:hypothetical protein
MPSLDVGFRFEFSCRCKACSWSMPFDELRAKGGKYVRSVKVEGVSLMDVEAPEGSCPRCGGGRFVIRFRM